MSRLKRFSLLAAALVCAAAADAQYYSWGPSPVSVRWRQLRTPDVRLVYPREFEAEARRTLWYMDTVRTHIDFGFSRGAMSTPVVMHTRNMSGNGMVMWAPRRMELLPAPDDAYSDPRIKRLVFHEYRHNVQYNNLRGGVIRPLSWLLGEQAAFLGVAQFSIYITEGDAVMAETELSSFGRGLQPSWTMHYRAVGDVGADRRSPDFWFSGSFRDYVPDHYRLGYQMVRWSYDRFGRFIWDDLARYVARNPQFITPMAVGLRTRYGLSYRDLFRRTFADLNKHWNSLPRVEDSSVRVPSPERSRYTTYRWPQWTADGGTIVSFKSDLTSASRVVATDAATGRERTLGRTGAVSSRPALADGTLWWTEYRSSLLWAERVRSRVVSLDLSTGRRRTLRTATDALYPTPTDGGEVACVEYDERGRFSIVRGTWRLAMPEGVDVTGLAWDDATRALYFTGLDDGGMFLARADENADEETDDGSASGFTRLTPSRHITTGNLRAAGGRLYFGSIASGRDEAHMYDIATGVESRLSSSRYGSFHPSTPSAEGRVALTTYDRHGYHLAVQNLSDATVEEPRALPLDLVNPPWKRWEVPVMDSMVYTAEAAERSTQRLRPRRFSRLAHIFNPHSWVPADFYPPQAIEENRVEVGVGATVMSQSLLSDATSWLAWGLGRAGGGQTLRGGVSWNGLGPRVDVSFFWGGSSQLLYSRLPTWYTLKLKPHLSATARLSLPMTVSSGRVVGTLTPAVEYNYSNGLIYSSQSSGEIVPASVGPTGGWLTRGVERLSFSVRHTSVVRTALSELQPRWGVTARVGYVTNPSNRNFRNLVSASAGVWLPGVGRTHGTRLRAAWQHTSGRDDAPFTFQMKELFPRGATYNFSTSEWRSAAVDYQLPVWYPEGGIPGILYFKRVRVNAFADLARWRDNTPGGAWNRLHSYGAEISVDISPLRMPATNNCAVTFTIARPSDTGKPFFSFGIDMPL